MFRQKANYCYRVWLVGGKPSHGELHTAKLRSHAQFRHAVRRVKRAAKYHQARALFGAAMDGDICLMKEMKRMRTGKGPMDQLPDTVEGATGNQEIANKFREVYETLYNSAGSEAEMERLQQRIQTLVCSEDSMAEIRKVTSHVVKTAAVNMKPHKMDVSQGFTSDCIINAPDILFEQLALVFQDWLCHGTVTRSILACAFIPLVKSSLKDPALTDSYRAIAGSSLLLKLFERCILQLWGDRLNSDTLQFGFKKRSGTSSATWLVQEVLQHFLREGSKPIAVVLDCSQAFDKARFDLIFSALLDRGVPAVVVRVLTFSYKEQLAWVRWGRNTISSTFSISNGTRQGSVASPAFWNVYLDPIFTRLRKEDVGCHIGGVFIGVIGYADDLILLAPSRNGAQKMLDICVKFADEFNIKFSTNPDPAKSKSKAIFVVGRRGGLPRPVNLRLSDMPLPWVERAEHLGHVLHEDGTMRHDVKSKRAQFIDSSAKIRESFGFAHPLEQLTAVEKYCTALYGSNLWDLHSVEAEQVFAAWRRGVKLAWNVPRGTRSYLLQEVLAPGFTPLRVNLMVRSMAFFRSLLESPSPEVTVVARLAARDIRSTLGSNVTLVKSETGLDPWVASSAVMRASLLTKSRVKTPKEDQWRIAYLYKLLTSRLQAYYTGDQQKVNAVQELVDSLCIN
jgi:hypothetical protein